LERRIDLNAQYHQSQNGIQPVTFLIT